MGKVYNRVKVGTTTVGVGSIALNATGVRDAADGDWLSFAEAGVPNSTVVAYVIVDGHKFAWGTTGTYNAGTLTRDSGEWSWDGTTFAQAKLSLSGSAVVMSSLLAADIEKYLPVAGGTVAGNLTVTGSTALASATASGTVTISGAMNAASGGTTGNFTVGGTFTAASGGATGAWNVGGALTAASGSVAGNFSVSGTLTATTFAPSSISTGTISASGNVSAGGSISAGGNIATTSGGDIIISASVSGGNAALYNDTGDLNFSVNGGTLAMQLHSSGRVQVGFSGAGTGAGLSGGKFQVLSDIWSGGSAAGVFFENRGAAASSSANWYGWYGTGGMVYFTNGGANQASINPSGGAYTALSDVNKKKDIITADIGLAEVQALRPVYYRMKDDAEDAPLRLGFIAQEVQPHIPQAYTEHLQVGVDGEESPFIGLTDWPMIAALVGAVKQIAARVDVLEASN